MKGWLIVNEYLKTGKFLELQELFLKAAKARNVELQVHSNAEFVIDSCSGRVISKAFDSGKPDFIIFYDKDIALARAFEGMLLYVFNSAEAIDICDSKYKMADEIGNYNKMVKQGDLLMSMKEIRVPKTFKVPFTYENIGIKREASFEFLDLIEESLLCCKIERDTKCGDKEQRISAYPLIIKESYSSFGMGVHLANSREEAIDIICNHGNRECVIQEYIESAKGRDVRLQMVGDECVAAMMRSNDSDFRSNLTNGGVMEKYEPTEEDLALAKDVMNCLWLDFAGIDIMHDSDGKPIFCEANSNAHFKNLYDLTGVNTAEYIIDYILDEISSDNSELKKI